MFFHLIRYAYLDARSGSFPCGIKYIDDLYGYGPDRYLIIQLDPFLNIGQTLGFMSGTLPNGPCSFASYAVIYYVDGHEGIVIIDQ